MAYEALRLRRGGALRIDYYAGRITSRECADARVSRTDGYRDRVKKPSQRDRFHAHYSDADGIVPGGD